MYLVLSSVNVRKYSKTLPTFSHKHLSGQFPVVLLSSSYCWRMGYGGFSTNAGLTKSDGVRYVIGELFTNFSRAIRCKFCSPR